LIQRATDSASIEHHLFEFIQCSSPKKIFDKQPEDSNLEELQLGVDKGCFFRIWDESTAIKKIFEGFMIIRNWWWWQMT
jgi:hypothetical protein